MKSVRFRTLASRERTSGFLAGPAGNALILIFERLARQPRVAILVHHNGGYFPGQVSMFETYIMFETAQVSATPNPAGEAEALPRADKCWSHSVQRRRQGVVKRRASVLNCAVSRTRPNSCCALAGHGPPAEEEATLFGFTAP